VIGDDDVDADPLNEIVAGWVADELGEIEKSAVVAPPTTMTVEHEPVPPALSLATAMTVNVPALL